MKTLPELEALIQEFYEEEQKLEKLTAEAQQLEAMIPQKEALLSLEKQQAVLSGKPLPKDPSIAADRERVSEIKMAVRLTKLQMLPRKRAMSAEISHRSRAAFQKRMAATRAEIDKAIVGLDTAIAEVERVAGSIHCAGILAKTKDAFGIKIATRHSENIRSPIDALKEDNADMTRVLDQPDDNWVNGYSSSGMGDLCSIIERFRSDFIEQDSGAAAKESKQLASV